MTRNNQQRNATPESIVRYACERENQAIVYDDYAGFPVKVTSLDDRWWVTTPGEPLVPLDKYIDGEDAGYIFLCGPDGRVGALALAKLLGKALTNPEDKVDEVLHWRVAQLYRLGVEFDLTDEPLLLELDVFANGQNSRREGKYSVICYAKGACNECLFNMDGFDTKEDAEERAMYFFEFLERIGIRYTIF